MMTYHHWSLRALTEKTWILNPYWKWQLNLCLPERNVPRVCDEFGRRVSNFVRRNLNNRYRHLQTCCNKEELQDCLQIPHPWNGIMWQYHWRITSPDMYPPPPSYPDYSSYANDKLDLSILFEKDPQEDLWIINSWNWYWSHGPSPCFWRLAFNHGTRTPKWTPKELKRV